MKLGFRLPEPGPQGGFIEYLAAAWAPKRREIAFVAVNDEDSSVWAYLAETNGNPSQQIFSWHEGAGSGSPNGLGAPPTWSSDGRSLALIPVKGFVRYGKSEGVGRGDVWLIAADRSRHQKLTRTGAFTAAAWLPPAANVDSG